MKDLAAHRTLLLDLLKDIYQHPRLAPTLGFKGGTSLYFLHGLPRFSIDLDFNMLPDVKATAQDMEQVLVKHLALKDKQQKRYTWFWLGSYDPGQWNIKIEISQRAFPDRFEIKSLYGLSVPTMELPYQFAHKLVAITERRDLASRDIFDVWWFFSQLIEPDDDTIRLRTNFTTSDYLAKLIDYIPAHVSVRGILDGLGELLTEAQKKWVREQLLTDVTFYLKSHIN